MLSSCVDLLDRREPRVSAPVGPRTDRGSNPAAVSSDRGWWAGGMLLKPPLGSW